MNVRGFCTKAAIGIAAFAGLANFGHVYQFARAGGSGPTIAAITAALPDILVLLGALQLRTGKRHPAVWLAILFGAGIIGSASLWATTTTLERVNAVLPLAAALIAAWLIDIDDPVTEPAVEAQPSVTATVTAIPTPTPPPPVTAVTEPRVAAAAVTRRAVTEAVRPDDSSIETPSPDPARQRAILAGITLTEAPSRQDGRDLHASHPGAWPTPEAAHGALRRKWAQEKKTLTPA